MFIIIIIIIIYYYYFSSSPQASSDRHLNKSPKDFRVKKRGKTEKRKEKKKGKKVKKQKIMLKRERLTGDEQTKGCMAVGDLPTDIFSGSLFWGLCGFLTSDWDFP